MVCVQGFNLLFNIAGVVAVSDDIVDVGFVVACGGGGGCVGVVVVVLYRWGWWPL